MKMRKGGSAVSWRGLLAAVVVCAAVGAQQPDEAEPAGPRVVGRGVVGRAFPDWTGAVSIAADGSETAVDARFAERWCSHRGLVVAPRAGAAGAEDLEKARALVPADRTRGQQLRVQMAIFEAERTAPASDGARDRVLFVPGADALYAAPPRPWVAVHDGRGIVVDVAPLAEPQRIAAALAGAARRPNVNRLVGQRIGSLDSLVAHDVPKARGGAEAVPESSSANAAADGTDDTAALRAPPGGLVIYRFWTDGCQHCRASLPDLAALAARFDDLRLVPIHHQKGHVAHAPEWLREYLAELGVRGPWAHDPQWNVLKALMRRGGLDTATSVSFVVDSHGVIRWVHPGPRVHRDPDGRHAPADRDFRALEALVERWFDARR